MGWTVLVTDGETCPVENTCTSLGWLINPQLSGALPALFCGFGADPTAIILPGVWSPLAFSCLDSSQCPQGSLEKGKIKIQASLIE